MTAYVILTGIVHAALWMLEAMFFARAVLSFLMFSGTSFFERAYDVLCALTEPVITPLRMLFDRIEFAAESVIDIPFFVAYLIISVLAAVL